MAPSRKALLAAVLLCLRVAGSRRDGGAASVARPAAASQEQEREIQKLRFKVASLEDEIGGRKEETLLLESIVREKTAQVAALVGELEVLQVTNVFDDEIMVKANTHNEMLEKQIERLGNDLEDQIKKGESLEAQASKAEKRVLELAYKLDSVERINIEHRQKIEELGHNIQHAKDKISKVEREAKSKAEELAKIQGMWLPYWFSVHYTHCQELASAKWKLHGKHARDDLMQKVTERLRHAKRLVEPHLQTTQNKLVPVAKVHLNSLRNTAELYMSAVATRSTVAYRVCRDAIQPCMVKAQKFACHYWQESKKFSKPYITEIAAASVPHLSKAGVVLEPYLRPVTFVWRRLVMSGSDYHYQVQKAVKYFLEDNELLKTVSADRLACFTALAFFALLMLSVYKICSSAVLSVGIQYRKKNQRTQNRGRVISSNRKHKCRVDKQG